MKIKFILLLLVAAAAGGAWYWKFLAPVSAVASAAVAERKILYYQSAMHPWIKSDKPGKCPICGMDLVPVYQGEATLTDDTNLLTLETDSLTVVNVRTEIVARRPIIHTLHVIGGIQRNSTTAAWFVFDVFERDLPWIKIGQTIELTLPSAPEKNYTAQIKLHGTQPFADRDLDVMSDSTKIRAEISNPPVDVPGFEGRAYFNNLHAEAHIRAATPEVLAVPRSAVLSHRDRRTVFVDKGGGKYESREVQLGRFGDDFAEVLGGLEAGEKIVMHGGLLMDAEAQLVKGE